MSHRTALQRRHLAERPEPGGKAHRGRPEDEPQPETAGVVVGRELRRQPVDRIRDAGPDRDEDARAARRPAQGEGRERDGREDAERDPEGGALGVCRVSARGGEREQRHTGRDREHREPLAAADVLAQPPRRDREQEDEARPEQRLHERQRRPRERERLDDPAGEPERRAEQPARAAHEAQEEGEAKRPLRRRLARLERLQPHPHRVERGRAERREHAGQEIGHGRSGR